MGNEFETNKNIKEMRILKNAYLTRETGLKKGKKCEVFEWFER